MKEKLLRLIKKIEPTIKRQSVFSGSGMWYYLKPEGAVPLGRTLPLAIKQVEQLVSQHEQRKNLRIKDLYSESEINRMVYGDENTY